MCESQGYLEEIRRDQKLRKSFRAEMVEHGRRTQMSKVVARMTKAQMAELLLIVAGCPISDPVEIGWEMLFEQNREEEDRLMSEGNKERMDSAGLRGQAALDYLKRSSDRYSRLDALSREWEKMSAERYPKRSK